MDGQTKEKIRKQLSLNEKTWEAARRNKIENRKTNTERWKAEMSNHGKD